jgi:hypothetical protein
VTDRIEHADSGLDGSYERLRAAVLGAAPDGFRLGHGVLATRGVVAWMQTVTAVSSPAAQAAGGERSRPPAGEVVALPNAQQLVGVLAQMTLAIAA